MLIAFSMCPALNSVGVRTSRITTFSPSIHLANSSTDTDVNVGSSSSGAVGVLHELQNNEIMQAIIKCIFLIL